MIFSLGSCFSAEIGERLEKAGYNICVNPFGVLYNPASIASSLLLLTSQRRFDDGDIVLRDPLYRSRKGGATSEVSEAERTAHRNIAPCIGGYVSFFHHGSFTRATKEEFLENANSHLESARAKFREAETVIITFGTAWVFRHIGRDMIVSNCHKHPAAEFRREFLSVDGIVSLISPLIRDLALTGSGTQRRWIFTVSPIRHLKDGLHGNQISKSTLLLAEDALVKQFPQSVEYFPSYEIMIDDLRDYSWYAEDKVHPSIAAVDHIFDSFTKQYSLT